MKAIWSRAALAATVLGSLLVIIALMVVEPGGGPRGGGPVSVTVVLDFGGQLPDHPLGGSTAEWGPNGSLEAVEGPALWTIHLRLSGATVYSALERASLVANFTFVSEWYPGLGSHRVTAIAGVRDGTDGRYWQFWVNGDYAQRGADLTPLSDGDVVEWALRSPLQ